MSDEDVTAQDVAEYVSKEINSYNIGFDGDEYLFHGFRTTDEEVTEADVERYVRSEIMAKTTIWFCEGQSASNYVRRFTPT